MFVCVRMYRPPGLKPNRRSFPSWSILRCEALTARKYLVSFINRVIIMFRQRERGVLHEVHNVIQKHEPTFTNGVCPCIHDERLQKRYRQSGMR